METKIDFTGAYGCKRSLTIVAPEGLVTVIRNPRDYYRNMNWEDSEENIMHKYPDALIIPNNGVRISGWYYTEKTYSYWAGHDEPYMKLDWHKTELHDIRKTYLLDSSWEGADIDTNVTPYPKRGYPGQLEDFHDSDIIPVDERCNYQTVIAIKDFLRWEQYQENKDKEERDRMFAEEGRAWAGGPAAEEITYYLFGEKGYFKSNADHYFAIGWTKEESRYPPLDDFFGGFEGVNHCTCYFGGWWGELGNNFRSCEITANGEKYYAGVGTSGYIHRGKYKYQMIDINSPLNNTSNVELTEKLNFNGYRSSSTSLEDIRRLTNHPNITLKDTNFVFKEDQLVAMKLPNETSSYKAFGLVKQGDEEHLKILSKQPEPQFPHKLVVSGLSKILKFIKNGEDEYLLFYRRDMSSILSDMKIESNLANFTGKYLVGGRLNGNSYMERWVSESTRTPMTKGTLLIEPIFSVPVCAYTNLCTVNDHNGAMGSEKRDEKIKNELEWLFLKEELQYNKVDNWSATTVREELKKLKESKAKFKILFIKAHGGKYQNVPEKLDKSYCLMSEGNKQVVDFDDIKYLLKDGKSDEYYMIVCNSCYGGGIVEDFLHTDINLTSYSGVIPSSELKANYVFIYADCANSPGWGNNSDLYRFDITDEEAYQYQNQGSRINALVQETRTKNLNELTGLLSRHYQTLKSMLKLDKFFWTDQTFSDSLTNAGNLILAASKDTFDHFNVNGGSTWNQLGRKYPIVFLLWRVLGQLDGGKTETPVWDDNQLLNEQTPSLSQFITDPQLFKNASMRFVRNNPNSINQKTKYLLQTDESINRALEGDDIEENVKRLNEIIGFFYDCFCTWRQMVKNSEPITNLNGKKHYWLQTLLLDDNPGIVIHGDWSGTAFPTFPGFEMVAGITNEKIEELKYKRGT